MKTAARIAILLGGFALLYCFSPPVLPLCGFRWLTGRPCPFCGLTRAMFALAKGHWGEALQFHALSPLAAGLVAAVVWGRTLSPRLWASCGAAFGIYGVWRIFA